MKAGGSGADDGFIADRNEGPLNPGNLAKLNHYEIGATSMFASRIDQRFSYCLFVPRDYDEKAKITYPLVVIIHGTERGAQRYRDRFIEFAKKNQCIVLAPLFPCGIIEPGDMENYKFIAFHDIRYDLVLLGMIDEISEKYRIEARRFLMFGFSGGGHFTHRFLYLHPDRLLAASIGAPGMVTLLDDTLPWWRGTGNLTDKFGIKPDIEAMKHVGIQMIVGGDDKDTWEITIAEDDPLWMPGANDAGRTRIERLQSLRDSFIKQGLRVQFEVVPGVAHMVTDPFLDRVTQFFSDAIKGRGKGTP